jgi:hypothetical protein
MRRTSGKPRKKSIPILIWNCAGSFGGNVVGCIIGLMRTTSFAFKKAERDI